MMTSTPTAACRSATFGDVFDKSNQTRTHVEIRPITTITAPNRRSKKAYSQSDSVNKCAPARYRPVGDS